MIRKIANYYFSSLVVAINHLIGIVGLHIAFSQAIFVLLTPLNLWINAITIVWQEKNRTQSFWIFVVVSFLAGMIFEILGVYTGVIFGEYSYSSILGWQILNVPIIIGVNWFVLLYSSICLLNHCLPQLHFVLKAILAASAMAFIDFFIEPFAIEFNLWQWQSADIPLQNYIAWFFISLGIVLPFGKRIHQFQNRQAAHIYIVLLIFFIVNYLLL